MRLPSSIRQRILFHVIGGNTLHITRDEVPAHTGQPQPEPAESGQGSKSWRFCICTSIIPEDAAFRIASGDGDETLDDGLHWSARHVDCFVCAKMGPIPAAIYNDPVQRMTYPPESHGPHQLDVINILRSCRALSSDATAVLYGRNTFAFCVPQTLATFLTDRTPEQRDAITALAILPAQVHVWRAARDRPTISQAFTTPLPALESVHVDIEWQGASGPERRVQRMLRDSAFLERRLRGVLALGPLVAAARAGNPRFRCAVTFITSVWTVPQPGVSLAEAAATLLSRDQERGLANYVHAALVRGGSNLEQGEAMLAHRYGQVQQENLMRQRKFLHKCKRVERNYEQALAVVHSAPKSRKAESKQMLVKIMKMRPRGWPMANFSDVSEDEA